MAKTLANLRTGIRLYLDEAAQTDWLDTEVLREANYAYQDLAGKVIEVYEDFYFTTTPISIDIVAKQQQYLLSSSIIKTRRVEINYKPSDTNSQSIRAISIGLDEIPLNLSNQGLGGSGIFNAGYYLIGDIGTQYIGFVPIPTDAGSGAGNGAIKVWGIQLPSDLVNDTDNVNIPWADRFCKLVELKAAAELLKKGQQEVKAADDLIAQYQQGVLEMKTFIKDRKSDGVNMIEDSEMSDNDFSNPLGA